MAKQFFADKMIEYRQEIMNTKNRTLREMVHHLSIPRANLYGKVTRISKTTWYDGTAIPDKIPPQKFTDAVLQAIEFDCENREEAIQKFISTKRFIENKYQTKEESKNE